MYESSVFVLFGAFHQKHASSTIEGKWDTMNFMTLSNTGNHLDPKSPGQQNTFVDYSSCFFPRSQTDRFHLNCYFSSPS